MPPPFLAPTLRGYRVAWLRPDVLAGLALAAVALPSQMATARLAGLAPATGLLAFAAGSICYALFGTNCHLAVGADSTIAPVLATAAATFAVAGSHRYVEAMAVASLLAGALLVVVGLARLGWIAEFLSTPVITGLLSGIGVEIIVRQLPAILGIPAKGTTTLSRLDTTVHGLGALNSYALAIAAGVIAVIAIGLRIDRRLPGSLVALVLSIVVVKVFGLADHHGVAVLGALRRGIPRFGLPPVDGAELRRLVESALTVAFLCVAQTAATVRGARRDTMSGGDFNRDLVGLGAGSVLAGLGGGFAVDASPPITAIASSSGGRTQLASVTAAIVALVVAAAVTAPLASLPDAALGAILIYIALRLFRLRDLIAVLRFDRLEFGLSCATLLCVAFVGIEQGVVLAMILSLADRTRRSARPRDAVLGREPGTDHWIPNDIGRPIETVPGILVYLVYAPIWYGNAEFVRRRILDLVVGSAVPITGVVLDADAIADVDFTGLGALRELVGELAARHVTFVVARASHLVHHDLKHGALIEEIGHDRLFASVDEAVIRLAAPPDSPLHLAVEQE